MSSNIVPGAATIGVEPTANVRDWPPLRAATDVNLGEHVIVRREDNGQRITEVFTPCGTLAQLEAQAAILARTWDAEVVPTLGGAS
jgi:hypothetical protein